MNSSFLYHAWGLYNHECTREEYKGNTIILHIETKDRKKECPKCGHRQLVKNGFRIRDFIGLPIGGKKIIIRMKVQRYKCKNKDCDHGRQEGIPFAMGSCGYTHRFAKYVVDLLRDMTLKDAANFLGVSWDTVKDIHTRHLEHHYAPPSLEGVDSVGIDEFAVRKGHVCKTIVVDLKSGRIIHVGNGKGQTHWVHMFDYFHVVKLMSEPLSQAYCLKEQLRGIWAQVNKEEAETIMQDWVRQARESKVPQLVKMAATVMAYRSGILTWYDCHISTGEVEGINNKIKVMKRTAYGFRDERYFELRLYALYDCRITRNVG